MGLGGRYIGDGYPLCSDLPKQHFLKKGAKYRLLGYSRSPELGFIDPAAWADSATQKRFAAEPTGALYQKLCNPDTTGACRFAPIVTLTSNIACAGAECTDIMGSIHTVMVKDNVYYEYIQVRILSWAIAWRIFF